MSDLKITVKDFRAIHSADIALNGITVIAGVNGSGKSTLSRLLYTIFDKVKTLSRYPPFACRYQLVYRRWLYLEAPSVCVPSNSSF